MDNEINSTEEDVLSGLDSRSIALLVNPQNSTAATIPNGRTVSGCEYTTCISGKVARSSLGAECRVRGTSCNTTVSKWYISF